MDTFGSAKLKAKKVRNKATFAVLHHNPIGLSTIKLNFRLLNVLVLQTVNPSENTTFARNLAETLGCRPGWARVDCFHFRIWFNLGVRVNKEGEICHLSNTFARRCCRLRFNKPKAVGSWPIYPTFTLPNSESLVFILTQFRSFRGGPGSNRPQKAAALKCTGRTCNLTSADKWCPRGDSNSHTC